VDTLLWALQIILGIKLLSVAFTHGLRQGQPTMQQARRKLGAAAEPLHVITSIAALVLAAGFVLPAATAGLSAVAPLAAAATAAMMLASIALHVTARETPNVPVSLVLLATAAFVAYGRCVFAPLGT
jgi:hypothetical protein